MAEAETLDQRSPTRELSASPASQPVASTLPGMEAALNPLDEAQLRSETMRLVFEASDMAEAWTADYLELIAEGWSWRQAVYMIWAGQPKPRTPATEDALAREVLGLASARVIRQWKQENPAMELRIRRLQMNALGKHRGEVLAALVESAANTSYRNYRDRELYLKLTGDYVPRERVDVGAASEDLSQLSTEELAALAQVPVDHGD